MRIDFQDEAGETYQNVLRQLTGYTVEIQINTDDENIDPDHLAIFDAKIIGPDIGAEWYDAVIVKEFDEETGDGKGKPFSVRAARVTVY